MTIKLRAITVGFYNVAQIKNLISSFQEHMKIPCEFFIWDNGGCEELKTIPLSNSLVRVKICGNGVNEGFSVAVNQTAKLESENNWEFLFLVNPDAVLLTDFTHKHLLELQELHGIAGLLVYEDESQQLRQASARHFPTPMTYITGREGLLTRLWPSNPWSRRYLNTQLSIHKVSPVDWVSGCAMIVSKQHWQILNGFDERYFLYVEDVDLGRRCQQFQIPVYFYPFIALAHEGRGTSKNQPSSKADRFHHQAMWLYYVKWNTGFLSYFKPFIYLLIWMRFWIRRFR